MCLTNNRAYRCEVFMRQVEIDRPTIRWSGRRDLGSRKSGSAIKRIILGLRDLGQTSMIRLRQYLWTAIQLLERSLVVRPVRDPFSLQAQSEQEETN